jgi:hypothetical protein
MAWQLSDCDGLHYCIGAAYDQLANVFAKRYSNYQQWLRIFQSECILHYWQLSVTHVRFPHVSGAFASNAEGSKAGQILRVPNLYIHAQQVLPSLGFATKCLSLERFPERDLCAIFYIQVTLVHWLWFACLLVLLYPCCRLIFL